ncbi:TrbG/VirB9 family P-type conjugative transfer protein [Sphingomonas sp.]|uniref:TrbG/VirB9 family P-type conjugative transfer protein n=1 Tax=Sphingomonas sp. TaxID=28214 RepID=UPI00258FFE5F|nr:TrbG/VirB9 family P-type conjugative transfer protein [Sphingomonas sp.]
MIGLGLAALVAPLLAQAAAGGQGDPRLQLVPFVPDTVTTVPVAGGYVTTIVLGPDERVVSVAVGNAAAWEVTPSKSGDRLFVRSLIAGVTTNLEVVTDQRQYSFLLRPTFAADPQAAFRLAFDYGHPAPASRPAVAAGGPIEAKVDSAPFRYRVSGDRRVRPSAIDDDGVRTRFAFPDASSLPAIYAIDDQGREVLVTARQVDDMWIVDRVWPRYVLRLGHARAEARRLPPVAIR